MKKNSLINRRNFALSSTGLVVASATPLLLGQQEETKKQEEGKQEEEAKPREAPFERDYEPPKFQPDWENEQLNRTMVQDFVIYAHSSLDMVKKLLEREPRLINAAMDWGGGDFETALGGASHLGRVDTARYLLSKGARMDIFSAASLGLIGTVKEMLSVAPELIDSPGIHGYFNLHVHAYIASELGHENGKELLDHLQSIKEVKIRPMPFLRKQRKEASDDKKKSGK